METKKIIKLVSIAVILILGIIIADNMMINVNANEVVVLQDPIDGEIHVHSQPGVKNQNFAKVGATYFKQYTYAFDIPEDKKDELNYDSAWVDPNVSQYGIKIQFNDNGEAYIFGSMPTYFPEDEVNVKNLHSKWGTFESVTKGLIQRQLNSAVFNVGPLMSSKESVSEKRSDLLRYIEDIVTNGTYQMKITEKKEIDGISKDTIVVKRAELAEDLNSPGGLKRQSSSEISLYGIRIGSPVISRIVYSPKVKGQIDTQQELMMNIQTAKAKSLEAQQNEKTAISQKAAAVAAVEAKYEAEKRQATIEAEKERDVALVNMKKAEYNKQEMILRAEGEAEYKRKIMIADGALDKKLEAYTTVMTSFFENWGKNKVSIVPYMSSGGNSASGGDALNQFFMLQNASVAKQLGLDFNIQK